MRDFIGFCSKKGCLLILPFPLTELLANSLANSLAHSLYLLLRY